MTKRALLIVCFSILYFTGRFCVAAETLPQEAQTVVKVRGEDAVVEKLNMGPSASAFWSKLQILMSNREMLEDFSKLQNPFGFSISEYLDYAGVNVSVPTRISDIKDYRYSAATDVNYNILENLATKNGIEYQLYIKMNLAQICLTASEVRRFYGKGQTFLRNQLNYPLGALEDQTGIPFGEVYSTTVDQVVTEILTLTYYGSGCLDDAKFLHIIKKLNPRKVLNDDNKFFAHRPESNESS